MATTPLDLHPDRLLPSEPGGRAIRRHLYDGVAELPISSPHGHVPAQWLASNAQSGSGRHGQRGRGPAASPDIDDTRAFCSIPTRHDLSRRLDAGFVAPLVAGHRLCEAADVLHDLVVIHPRRAVKL